MCSVYITIFNFIFEMHIFVKLSLTLTTRKYSLSQVLKDCCLDIISSFGGQVIGRKKSVT